LVLGVSRGADNKLAMTARYPVGEGDQMKTTFQRRILDLIRDCNRWDGRVDFNLAERAQEFGFTSSYQFKQALEEIPDRHTSVSFDHGFAVVIAKGL
jgi:hypothetical protein